MYLSLSAGVVGHTCICPGSLKKLNILPLAAGTKSQAEHNSAVQRAVCGHSKSQQKRSHLQSGLLLLTAPGSSLPRPPAGCVRTPQAQRGTAGRRTSTSTGLCWGCSQKYSFLTYF